MNSPEEVAIYLGAEGSYESVTKFLSISLFPFIILEKLVEIWK